MNLGNEAKCAYSAIFLVNEYKCLLLQRRELFLSHRECESSIHYLVKSKRYCQGDCAPVTKCGPATIPEEHLKVSLT